MKRNPYDKSETIVIPNRTGAAKRVRRTIMRIALVLASLACLSVCASADTIIISQDGSWGTGPNCPATYCTSPGDSWHWSFEINSNPVPSSFVSGSDFEAAISDFEFSDAGTVIASLTDSQTEITFFAFAQCGGLSTDDQTTVNECADNQLYNGDESTPVFVAGSYSPQLIPEVGGCGDTPGAACSGVTFGNITVAVVPAQTPEPATVVIALVPLLVVGIVRRKRTAA